MKNLSLWCLIFLFFTTFCSISKFEIALDKVAENVEYGYKTSIGIGGVMVNNRNGEVIYEGSNSIIGQLQNGQKFLHNDLDHFQTHAIKWYWENKQSLSLPNPQQITIISSLDPCLMCASNILLSGFNVGSVQTDEKGGVNFQNTGKFDNLRAFPKLRRKLLNKFGYYKVNNIKGREAYVGPDKVYFKQETVPQNTFQRFGQMYITSLSSAKLIERKAFVNLEDLQNLKDLSQSSHTIAAIKRYDPNALKLKDLDFNILKDGKVGNRIVSLLNGLVKSSKMAKNAAALIDPYGNLLISRADQFQKGPIYTAIFNILQNYFNMHFQLVDESSISDFNDFKSLNSYRYLANPKDCVLVTLNLPSVKQFSLIQGIALYHKVHNENFANILYLNDPQNTMDKVHDLIAGLPPLYRKVGNQLKYATPVYERKTHLLLRRQNVFL